MPHDKNKLKLNVGDLVLLSCLIIAVHEGETACNVTAEPVERPEGETYIPVIAGNSRLYEKVVETNHDNPVAQTKQFRKDLDEVLQRLKRDSISGGPHPCRSSAERSTAIRKVQEAIMWLGMDLKALNEPNPYPESDNPQSPVIEPTADGLTL
jgi:hypothetical protein